MLDGRIADDELLDDNALAFRNKKDWSISPVVPILGFATSLNRQNRSAVKNVFLT